MAATESNSANSANSANIAQNIQSYIQLIDETSQNTPSSANTSSNSDNTSSSTSSWSLITKDAEDSRAAGIWPSVCSVCINLFIPFINGMMLGFGEIAAHEVGFYFGWGGSKVAAQKERERQAYLRERESNGRVVWDTSSNSIRDAGAASGGLSASKWFK